MGSVGKNYTRESLLQNFNKTVTPVTSETHKILQNLDSGLRTIHFRAGFAGMTLKEFCKRLERLANNESSAATVASNPNCFRRAAA